jgi:hypothetical protein
VNKEEFIEYLKRKMHCPVKECVYFDKGGCTCKGVRILFNKETRQNECHSFLKKGE